MKGQVKKNLVLSVEKISISCTTQEYDDVTTTYCPISALLSVLWSLNGS